MTARDLLVKAAQQGLTISARGDRLAVRPNRLLTPNFANLLRAHKPELLALLRLHFVIVESEALGATIFFAENEETRAVLVEAGAEPASVYTRDELRVLVEQHRKQPFTVADLLRLHEARRMFGARIASTPKDE